jgi:hypothetical protein
MDLLQTHPRLKKLVFCGEVRVFTMVLVSEEYELKPKRAEGDLTERDPEFGDEVFVDIDAELAILRRPRETPWQLCLDSIFLRGG